MKFSKNHSIHQLTKKSEILKAFRADTKKMAAEHRQTMQDAEKAMRELKAAMDKLNNRI